MRNGSPTTVGPKAATLTTRHKIRAPMTPLTPNEAMRRRRAPRGVRGGATRRGRRATSTLSFGLGLIADTGVKGGIYEICQDIEHRENHREQKDGCLHEDVVPVGDGSNGEIPDPRPREDRFGDHRTPKEVPGFQSDH